MLAVLVPDDVGVRQRDLRGDPDVGEAVVEEREIVEHVLARLVAVHVHAKAGGPRRELLRQLQVGVHRVLSLGWARAGTGPRPRAGRAGWGRVGLARLRFGPQPCEHLLRVHEVMADGGLRRDRIARPEGVEHRDVEAGDPPAVRARDGEADVGARVGLQEPPDARKRAVGGDLHEAPVEAGVRGGLGDGVACLRGMVHGVDVPGQRLEVPVRQAGNREADDERLELRCGRRTPPAARPATAAGRERRGRRRSPRPRAPRGRGAPPGPVPGSSRTRAPPGSRRSGTRAGTGRQGSPPGGGP